MSKPVAGTSGANSAGLIIKVNITASKQDIDSAYVTLQNYVSKKPPLEINAKLRDDVVKNINVQIGALNSKTLNKVELLGKLNKTATEDQIRKQVGKWAKPITIPVGVSLKKSELSTTVNELKTFINNVRRQVDEDVKIKVRVDFEDIKKNSLDKEIERRAKQEAKNQVKIDEKANKQKISTSATSTNKVASNEEKIKQQRKYNALIEEEIRLIKQSTSASKSADKSTFYKDYTANQRTKLQSIEKELSAARQGIALKDGVVVDVNTAELDKLIAKSKDALREMKLLDAQAHSIELAPKSATNAMQVFDKLGNRMTEYFKKHGNEIKKNAQLYDQYRTIYNKLNAGDYATVSDASAAFSQFRMECRKAGVEVDTFGNLLRRTFDTRVRSYISNIGVMQLEMALRDIVRSAIEVDTAMTELKKVTNETDATYTSFLNNATERAAKLGATLTEVVNATADFARLGYSIPEAEKMSDAALTYLNIGDGVEDITQSSESIISTMQGFQLSADQAMDIVDKLNEVGNNFATSSGDIGEGLKRSSAALSAAGNDLDQSIALFTGAQEITQDADVVGTALKTKFYCFNVQKCA